MRFVNGDVMLSYAKKKNILEHEGFFYQILPLNPSQTDYDKKGNKGGNSTVYRAIDSNTNSEYAIKFLRYPRTPDNNRINKRFQNEIDALYEAKRNNFDNVVEISFDGLYTIGDHNFMYYVMEKGDTDLTAYLRDNKIPTNQKYILCYEIIRGISQLHSMNLYHRDIKPDNIYIIDGRWKVGDLGLSEYRNSQSLDKKNEKIGPFGWLSPEVMNKVLCKGTALEAIHNCIIDEFSDIFQLGKLIWFIFNGNVPVGQIKLSDFRLNKSDLFALIFKMLQYNKNDRGTLEEYEEAFEVYAN